MPAFQRPVDQRWLNTVSCFLKIGIHHLWPEIDGGNFTSEWCHSVEIQTRAQVVSMDPTRSYSMKSHSGKCPSSTQGLYNWRTDSAFDRQLCPARWPAHLGLYSFCREHNEMSVYTIHQEAKNHFHSRNHPGCYRTKKYKYTYAKSQPTFLFASPNTSSTCWVLRRP